MVAGVARIVLDGSPVTTVSVRGRGRHGSYLDGEAAISFSKIGQRTVESAKIAVWQAKK